jgi:hypothetical protein
VRHQHRQRGAHQRRGRQQRQHHQHEPRARERHALAAEPAVELADHRIARAQRGQDQEPEEPHAQLERRVRARP